MTSATIQLVSLCCSVSECRFETYQREPCAPTEGGKHINACLETCWSTFSVLKKNSALTFSCPTFSTHFHCKRIAVLKVAAREFRRNIRARIRTRGAIEYLRLCGGELRQDRFSAATAVACTQTALGIAVNLYMRVRVSGE